MFALTDTVAAALIGGAATITAAGFTVVGVMLSRVKASVGEPNGHKSLVAMAERLLAGQAGQDNRLARLENEVVVVKDEITGNKARITILESAFDLAHKEGP